VESLREADSRCPSMTNYDKRSDLSGEILLSWPLTGRSWSAAAAFAFHVLADVED
jgi:hypothetical protein